MPTFAELGMPFRLFEADVGEATRYLAEGACSICGAVGPAFELGIGADLIVPCSRCWTENALDAHERVGKACRSCGVTVPFPAVGKTIACCYACLRAGRAALTQDTELGMVRWEDAEVGLTHAMPTEATYHPDWETAIGQDGWPCAKVDRDALLELVRTPAYVSWQGERWRFCCGRIMVFIGGWPAADFAREAEGGDGMRLFLELMDDAEPEVWPRVEAGTVSTYLFRCTTCGARRGYYDST
jgi:uncharacterized protein CbrC (UPF0167 family)